MQMIRSRASLIILTFVVFLGTPSFHASGSESKPREQLIVDLGLPEDVRAELDRYRATGKVETLSRSDSLLFPYGHSQPIVRCRPLQACAIELEPGEAIHGVAIGDTERWIASPIESGHGRQLTQHIVIKPKGYDLSTNLIVATSRRVYHLTLLSPSKRTAHEDESSYVRRVRFYYPEDLVQRWDSARRRTETDTVSDADAINLGALDARNLHFDYRVRGKRKLAWFPKTVFDDGSHVYMQLPPSVTSSDLPAVLVSVGNEETAVANYRFQRGWFVVDGLFDRAQLVLGVGKRRETVRIERQRPDTERD